MPQQHFYIEGRSYGFTDRYPLDSRKLRPISYACFCPECAEVWARACIWNTQFMVYTIPCRKHNAPCCLVPGSLWPIGDPDFLAALPLEVLSRELLLHLDYAESKLL